MDYKTYIWNTLLADIQNEYGVAALMGNLQAESGLCPYRLQGDFSSGYTTSLEYTSKVDSGEISEYDFVHNGPNGGGYGLAQWTFYTRKQALYDWKRNNGYSSIGSVELAVDYLLYELKTTYTGVYNTLTTATSIRTASDKVLHDFENPADQSVDVEILRGDLGSSIYNEMKGTSGGGGSTPGGSGSGTSKRKKFNFILFNKRRNIYYG